MYSLGFKLTFDLVVVHAAQLDRASGDDWTRHRFLADDADLPEWLRGR